MHALNNAIGFNLLEPAAMSRACDTFLEEMEFEGSPEDRGDHEIPGSGWYSEAVLATALRAEGNIYSLDVNDPIRHTTDNPARIFAPDTAGVVVNRTGAHWFAYKSVEGQIWCVDSMNEPRKVSYADYLQDLAQRKHKNAFAVVVLPEET